MDFETVIDGFLLTLGFRIANLLFEIVMSLAAILAIYVGIRLVLLVTNKRATKQKGVSDNND